MKRVTLLTFGLLMGSCFLYGQGLDEVLQQYFETIGQDKLVTVQTMTMKGKSVQMGMETPFTTIVKRPDKFRLEVDIQGQMMVQAFDGEKGWLVAPWTGTTDAQQIPAEQTRFLKWQAEIDGFLYNYKERDLTTELIGKEDLEGTEVYKIKQINPEGDVFTYYMDTENFVILKTEIATRLMGNEIKQEAFNSNFREVDGMIFPFSIENKTQGQVANQVVVDTIIFNQQVNDSLFIMPVKKVPEAEPQQ